MTPPRARPLLARLAEWDRLNFVLTNLIPRKALTRLVGCWSRIENPVVRDLSIGVWRLFADLDLSDARDSHFRSMHDCFTRGLREGARPVDRSPDRLTSPCDGILGAHGCIAGDTLLQAKGQHYSLQELLGGRTDLEQSLQDGCYLTLRLTSGMYHRFHAPDDCRVTRVTYFPGEVFNVNPPTLRRIAKLFCRNERAVLECRLEGREETVALVPVAAVLVASIRLHFLDVRLHLDYRGPHVIDCDAAFDKGEEMGWFEHGSTIIVLAPRGYALCEGLQEAAPVRMGQGLLRRA